MVLLRRLLFRSAPSSDNNSSLRTNTPIPLPQSRTTLYDHLSHQTLTTLERLLLFSLAHEAAHSVRRKAIDTICDVANQGMLRGRPWHALQAQAFSMSHSGADHLAEGNGETQQQRTIPAVQLRESAYRVFAGCPNLVMDLQLDAVLGVFQRGLRDQESVEVRYAALLASVAFLSSCDATQLALSISLLTPMLDTLPQLASSLNQSPLGSHLSPVKTSNYHHLSTFISTLIPLTTTHPILFSPHLQSLLNFFPALILPPVDCGPTPTAGKPYPAASSGSGSSFIFPPHNDSGSTDDDDDIADHTNHDQDEFNSDSDERSTLRLSALEFMISLSESRPNMVKKVPGWTEVIVRACLEGMGEFEEDEGMGTGLETWLREDPSTSSSSAETDAPPALYEQSLDRLACAMGGKTVLPPAFQHIPSMMASYDWRVRHAGLMAIAAIGEGTGKVMQKELEKIIELVTPMFNDSHPRVRYAACQCVGQLCTDLEDIIQQRFHQQLFNVLIPALEDPEPRVHAHAASALINFCEGVQRENLLPYLDPIVERLLKLLNPPGDPQNGGQGYGHTRRYVQEQAITTLAMVADASEGTFAKHYGTIMPLLLNVLRNADSGDYRKLRVKAMECAGLIAIAVGPDVFRPDSKTLVELLIRIQQGPIDPEDTQLGHYLIATWAKVCQALGKEFEPYLPLVMPSLLATANAKADLSLYDEDDERNEDREGYEVIVMDGQTYGVRTSVMDEKCQAFETLVIYCSTLGPLFAPFLGQTLEVTLPSLKFYFHEGVREACAMLIPMLLSCGKQSNTLTNQMVSAVFTQLINCISSEHDSTFLASLYKYFTDSMLILGGAPSLPPEYIDGVLEATKRQLQTLAERRKSRAARANAINNGSSAVQLGDFDRDEMALVEEIEDFALEDMGKMLMNLDPNHPLLVAVSGVRDLGFNTYDSDEEEELS